MSVGMAAGMATGVIEETRQAATPRCWVSSRIAQRVETHHGPFPDEHLKVVTSDLFIK